MTALKNICQPPESIYASLVQLPQPSVVCEGPPIGAFTPPEKLPPISNLDQRIHADAGVLAVGQRVLSGEPES